MKKAYELNSDEIIEAIIEYLYNKEVIMNMPTIEEVDILAFSDANDDVVGLHITLDDV